MTPPGGTRELGQPREQPAPWAHIGSKPDCSPDLQKVNCDRWESVEQCGGEDQLRSAMGFSGSGSAVGHSAWGSGALVGPVSGLCGCCDACLPRPSLMRVLRTSPRSAASPSVSDPKQSPSGRPVSRTSVAQCTDIASSRGWPLPPHTFARSCIAPLLPPATKACSAFGSTPPCSSLSSECDSPSVQ